jgi:hypothetical protein
MANSRTDEDGIIRNGMGAPWGGWADPFSPQAGDTPATRQTRASLRGYIEDRRKRGVPREGWIVDDSEEKDLDNGE